jgi:hypothetical protein
MSVLARRVAGVALAAVGAAMLAGLGAVLYERPASTLIVDLGIPGCLLLGLAGLALLLVGAAALRGAADAR